MLALALVAGTLEEANAGRKRKFWSDVEATCRGSAPG